MEYYGYTIQRGTLIVKKREGDQVMSIFIRPDLSVDNNPNFDFATLDQTWLMHWVASCLFTYDIKMHLRVLEQKWFNVNELSDYVIRTQNYAIVNVDEQRMAFMHFARPAVRIVFERKYFCLFEIPYVTCYYEKKKAYLVGCIRSVPHQREKFQRGIALLEEQKKKIVALK